MRRERFTERESNPARLESFTDGVVAVALTLLVLDLHVPKISGPVDNARIARELLAIAPNIFTFLASFVMIGFFWIGHHLMFWLIERSDRWLMWLNLAFLFPLVCLPFATALVAQYPSNGLAASVYMCAVVLTALIVGAQWRYATRAGLISSNAPPQIVSGMQRRLNLVIGLMILAALIAPFFPKASLVAMLFVIVYIVVTTGQHSLID